MSDNMYLEENRLKTFGNWTINFISQLKLAKTGFYFCGPGIDTVKCHFCTVEIGMWEEGDDIVTEHMRWSQNCPLLRRNINVAISRPSKPTTLSLAIDITPTIATSRPSKHKNPYYMIEYTRFMSFTNWPTTIKQKPQELSDAGFYYYGKEDKVKCFSCNGRLSDWVENDVPWEQHALHFSECKYLKLIKGQSYIDSIQKKITQIPSESESSSTSASDLEKSSGYDDVTNKEELHDSILCKVCFTCERNVAFIPCGHVVCGKCACSVIRCPMCRNDFDDIIRIYC